MIGKGSDWVFSGYITATVWGLLGDEKRKLLNQYPSQVIEFRTQGIPAESFVYLELPVLEQLLQHSTDACSLIKEVNIPPLTLANLDDAKRKYLLNHADNFKRLTTKLSYVTLLELDIKLLQELVDNATTVARLLGMGVQLGFLITVEPSIRKKLLAEIADPDISDGNVVVSILTAYDEQDLHKATLAKASQRIPEAQLGAPGPSSSKTEQQSTSSKVCSTGLTALASPKADISPTQASLPSDTPNKAEAQVGCFSPETIQLITSIYHAILVAAVVTTLAFFLAVCVFGAVPTAGLSLGFVIGGIVATIGLATAFHLAGREQKSTEKQPTLFQEEVDKNPEASALDTREVDKASILYFGCPYMA